MPETSGEARRLDAKARRRKGIRYKNQMAGMAPCVDRLLDDMSTLIPFAPSRLYVERFARRTVYALEVPPKRMHRRNCRQCCSLRAQGAWAQANRLKSTRAGQVLLFWIQASFGPSQQ